MGHKPILEPAVGKENRIIEEEFTSVNYFHSWILFVFISFIYKEGPVDLATLLSRAWFKDTQWLSPERRVGCTSQFFPHFSLVTLTSQVLAAQLLPLGGTILSSYLAILLKGRSSMRFFVAFLFYFEAAFPILFFFF